MSASMAAFSDMYRPVATSGFGFAQETVRRGEIVRVSNHPVYSYIPGDMRPTIEHARQRGQSIIIETPIGKFESAAGGPWSGPFTVHLKPKANRRKGGRSYRERQAAGRAARRQAAK